MDLLRFFSGNKGLFKSLVLIASLCASLDSFAQAKNYYDVQRWYVSPPVHYGETSEQACANYKSGVIDPEIAQYNSEKAPNYAEVINEYIHSYQLGGYTNYSCRWDTKYHSYNQHTGEYLGFHPVDKSLPVSAECQIDEQKSPKPSDGEFPRIELDRQNCYCIAPKVFDESIQWCVDAKEPPTDPNTPKDPTCNNRTKKPCHIPTGAKFLNETDITAGKLLFTRNYHSLNLADNGLGKGWHNPYLQSLSVSGDNLSIISGTGRGEPWRKVNGVWEGDADSDYLLTENSTGFTLTTKRNHVRNYATDGRLLSEATPQGLTTSYEYDTDNRLITVTEHHGNTLNFAYSMDGKDHIVAVTDSTGAVYGYEYDTNDNLTAVIYPDGNADDSDNPRRVYHYENTDFPNHVTGITSATGERFSHYEYNAEGKAIVSEHAKTTNTQGQGRTELSY